MKVQSVQVVWEALIGKARCRAVLQPRELLEFEHCQMDATGGESWTSLATNDTAELERQAEERFMLDLLIDVHQKQAEIAKLMKELGSGFIDAELKKDLASYGEDSKPE